MKLIPGVIDRLLIKLRPLMRLSPFDQTTEEGRAQERHRKVLLSALASAAAKVISVSTALISVPLTLNYLGVERYGLWMAISSVIAMLSFADLGMGNGVLSEVAKAHGKDDTNKIRSIISSGFAALIGMGTIVLVIFGIAYPFISWPALFNVKTAEAAAEVGPAVSVFVVIFVLNMPLGIVNRVQAGLQQSFRASVWQCVGSMISLVGILWVIHLKLALPWLVAALAGAPMVALLLNGVHFFLRVRPDLFPRVASVSREIMILIGKTGVLFLVLQISASIAFSSDNFLIARSLSAEDVAGYAIPEKLFSLIAVGLSMLLSPLWPAYGEAIARGDSVWVRNTLKKSIKISAFMAFGLSSVMLLASDFLLSAWVGHQVDIPMKLLVGLAVWKVFEACGGALSVYLNGARVVGVQVVLSLLTAVCSIGVKSFVLPLFGVSAIPWVTSACFVVFSLFPYYVLMTNKLPRLNILPIQAK